MEKTAKAAKVSRKNILTILKESGKIFGTNFLRMQGAVLVCATIIVALNFFTFAGPFLAFIASGFISLGYIQFSINLFKNKKPTIESVFDSWRRIVPAAVLRLLQFVFVFFWGLLLIVPGIIAAINYSFAMSIMSEKKDISAFDALCESKELVKGQRDNIFVVYLLFFFFMILIFCASMALPLLVNLFFPLPVWTMIVCGVVLCICFSCLILVPFANLALVSLYLEAKENMNSIKKTKKIGNKSIIVEN
ncbi:MAG: hypothetical protein RR400_01095 [Clostridia bacterium]